MAQREGERTKMIEVDYHKEKGIVIKGHALYAPIGSDIVCAGVSALYQTLVLSLYNLTNEMNIHCYLLGEKHHIDFYGELSECAQILIDSFLLGIGEIEKEYPKNVKLTKH